MELKDVATIKQGLSNKLLEGNNFVEIFEINTFKTNKCRKQYISIKDNVLDKYIINDKMLIFPQILTTDNKISFGKDFVGKTLGKNLFGVEFENEKIMKSFYYLFKTGNIHINVQSTIIQRISRQELSECEFNLINNNMLINLDKIEKLIKYSEQLITQSKQYQKGIVQQIKKQGDNNE